MDNSRRNELITKVRVILYAIPVGKNSPQGIPIVGNETLGKVVVDRIDSISKNPEEFKFMVGCVIAFLKEIGDKKLVMEKVKMEKPSGLTDSKGFLLTGNKKIY